MPNGTSTDQNASLSKGQFLALGVAATIAVGGLLYAYKNYTPRYPSNLNRVLDYYGFKTPEQKEALRFLMQQSGVKETDALLDGTAENQTALSRSILAFVSETQNKFTIRTGKQERWEVQTPDWIKDPALQKQILSALEILNMMDAVPPKFERRDAVCILGATRSTMVSRLSYAADLFLSNKLPANWLIMLSGERYVTPDHGGNRVDGSEHELNELAAKIGKKVATSAETDLNAEDYLTETDLMQAAYETSKLYGKFPARDVLINTPRRILPRPTTETTVTELCNWLKLHPEVMSITFVSDQPHVEYQRAIIAQVFEKNTMKNIKIEVIGSNNRIPFVNTAEGKISEATQALGSRIWAATPAVIDAIGLDMSDFELRAEFKKLYEKQPLIYSNFEAKLPKSNNAANKLAR